MTRLRRARLAGEFVALGMLFCPARAGLLVQRAVLWLTTFQPRALINPAAARQAESSSAKSNRSRENRNGFPKIQNPSTKLQGNPKLKLQKPKKSFFFGA
jgi:hypothetical protein